MKNKILTIIIIAITVKIMYVLFSLGYASFSEEVQIYHSQDAVELFKRNQSYWYERIAVEGHEKITPDQLGKCEAGDMQQSVYAFFPLYPFTVRFSMYAVNTGFNSMALFYSLVFSILLFVLFYKFVLLFYKSEKIAFWSTVVLMVFPFNYYFSMYYAEVLYLMLLMGAFICIHQKRWALFPLLLGLLVLSRPNGLLVLIPLFVYFLEKQISLDPKQWKNLKAKDYLPALTFLSAPLFLILYGLYLKDMTGDFFALKTAQIGWCRWTTAPWQPLLNSHSWQDYFKIAYLFGFIAISVVYIRKLPLSLNLLIWISLLIPLFYNTLTVPRYIAVIFVFFMLFGSLMDKLKNKWNIAIVILLFLAQLWTFSFWLISDELSF